MLQITYLYQDDVRAGLREPDSDSLPNTSGASRDKGRFAFE